MRWKEWSLHVLRILKFGILLNFINRVHKIWYYSGLVNILGDLRSTSSGIDSVVLKLKKNTSFIYCKFRYAVHLFQGVCRKVIVNVLVLLVTDHITCLCLLCFWWKFYRLYMKLALIILDMVDFYGK